MATTYTATINIRCWKEHTCAFCRSIYAYPFVRQVRGRGSSVGAAEGAARADAARKLQSEVDVHPCPTCGLVQPDMVGQIRAKHHKLSFWLTLSAFALILILRLTDSVQTDSATYAAAVVCALAALTHWVTDLKDPNKSASANRKIAARRIAKGIIRHLHDSGKAGSLPAELCDPPKTMGRRMGLGLVLAAVALVAAPEVVRSLHHWPVNDAAYPPVVGPGDETKIYMDHSITSLKGYWRGSAVVDLRDQDDPSQSISAHASTNGAGWGSSIYAKSSEKSSSSTPWVRLNLPEDKRLAGKTVTCDIQLNVEYPVAAGSSSFHTASDNMHRRVTLSLADSGAGGSYDDRWWEGTLLGMGSMLVAAFLLIRAARALQRRAPPTRVFT